MVDNDVVKNTKFNTLTTKANSLKKKIPDASTLIHINQHNTDKPSLVKKIGNVDKTSTKQIQDYKCFIYKN